MIGFIFVDILPGRDKEFMAEVTGRQEVVEAHLMTGEWNALLVVHGHNEADIVDFNLQFIRTLRDVEDTYVCLSAGAIKV